MLTGMLAFLSINRYTSTADFNWLLNSILEVNDFDDVGKLQLQSGPLSKPLEQTLLGVADVLLTTVPEPQLS